MTNLSRLRVIRETIGVNQTEFAHTLGVAPSFISGIERNVKEVSRDLLQKILEKYQVNINFLLSGEGEMFLSKPKERPLQTETPSPGAQIDQRLEKLEAQMAKIEGQVAEMGGQLKGKSTDSPDSGMFTSDPESEYAEDPEPVVFVESVAAGKPISQSEAQSTVLVPRRYIKTRPEDYYVGRIKGTSMTSAGIPDGCLALFRISDMPRDGGIQIVEWEGEATVKRIREVPGKGWKICFDDGTKRHIDIGPGEEHQIQGDFVAVLPDDE